MIKKNKQQACQEATEKLKISKRVGKRGHKDE